MGFIAIVLILTCVGLLAAIAVEQAANEEGEDDDF